MGRRIGIIAEGKSDVEVLNAILLKYLDPASFSIRKFAGAGSGGLRKKCCAWATALKGMGCTHLFVVHDLDDHDENGLRSDLQALVDECEFGATLVIIPVLEMEAWLLADPVALQKAFSLKKTPKAIRNTETVHDAKEHLRDLVWKLGRKRYLNTVHNVRIAEKARLSALRKCRSFKPLDGYVKTNLMN